VYKDVDVRRVCLLKYGGEAGYRAEVQRLASARDKRNKRAEVAIQKRRDRLRDLLTARGCELRGDSRLCSAYIYQNEGDPEVIAEVMEEMDFFHSFTKYRDFFEEEKRAELEYKGRYDADDVSESAQYYALLDWASRFETIDEACERPELPRSLVAVLIRNARVG
jgi:hypothetical protein